MKVITAERKKRLAKNVMILGDFNADGSYVCKKDMKTIRIHSDKNFHWLIRDDVGTTASNVNNHTYDRIVVYGDDMLRAVVPNSAKTFNFQKAYGLTNEQALKVSDHDPVEVELKSLESDETKGPKDKSGGRVVTEEDLVELKRGNLLLEREKLNLEIQILQMNLAKMSNGDIV